MLFIWKASKMSENVKDKVVQVFLEMQSIFPFPGYIDNNLNKYITIVQEIAKKTPLGSNILSIGAGPCDLEAILSKLGYNVKAIDDLEDHWHLMGQNRDRIKNFAEQMNVELIIESSKTSSLKKDYFDVVLLIDAIEHLHNSPRELLNYSISSLKTGGLLIAETPNAVSLAHRLKVLFGKSSQKDAEYFFWNVGQYRDHVREFTRSELTQILSYLNLDAINSRMTNVVVDTVEARTFWKKSIVKMYKLISGPYPNFRSTILISGKKPENWSPTDISLDNFKKRYQHIRNYNLDNDPDDILIDKMQLDA